MRLNKISLAVVAALAVATITTPAASAATKTITCYKGTQVKKVTSAAPKCPAGWSTTKPKTASAKTVSMNGTFKGSGTLVWSSSDVKVSSMSGTGGDSAIGLTKLTGSGSSSPQSSTALIKGTGTFSGSGGTLTFTLDNKSVASAESEKAPTSVSVSANAVITGGTGKFAGATGTLKITGNFSISSTAAGSSETQSFTATVTGTINLK